MGDEETLGDKIIDILLERGGFDHWWFNIEEEVQDEIVDALNEGLA